MRRRRPAGRSSSTGRWWPPPSAVPPRSSATAGTRSPSWSARPAAAASGPPAGSRSIPLDDDHRRGGRRRRATRWTTCRPNGERIRVRRTANLHTGGTIEDVTDRLHPEIADGRGAGRRGARHPGDRAGLPRARRRAAPTTSSSRPTSGPGWPTTSRSRWPSGSSTCSSPRPAAADGTLPRDLRAGRRWAAPWARWPAGASPRRCRTPPAAGPGRRCWSTSPAAC